AAEVIGITSNSIGGAIYTAKLLFATDEVFAWTIVIVLISVAFEKLVLMGIDKLQARWFV
ncbi:MAG: nitrate ABC transporter permease, partial [Oscillospiraceae bacterium]